MDKDRLELLKETEDYIPPVHTLSADELQSFYSQFRAAPEIIREMFLSGEIFHKLLYSEDIPPIMRLDENSEETALKNFLSEKNIREESVFLIYNYSKDEVDLIATVELADKFIYYWYPSADDLLIVSQHFNWIIGVRYDGALYFQKYYSRQTTLGADNE